MKNSLEKLYESGCHVNATFKQMFKFENNVVSNIVDQTNYANVHVRIEHDKHDTVLTIKARLLDVNMMDYRDVKQFRKFHLNCNGKTFAAMLVDLVKEVTHCCCFTDEAMCDHVLDRFIKQVS